MTRARNPFQHIDLRVIDIEEAWQFYSRVLPAIGFETSWRGKSFSGFDAAGTLPDQAWFGFTEDRMHRPNANRIAFWAESRERVDEIAAVVATAGGQNISGPRPCPEDSPTYYAVFFDDPAGNPLEVCHRTD